MKRIALVFTISAVLSLFLPALAQVVQQQVQQQEQRAENIRPVPDLPAKDSKLVEQEHQFARQMLEVSESEGRGFEAPMRSYTLLQIAQVYQQSDQEKARELLKDAFTASLGIQDDDEDGRVTAAFAWAHGGTGRLVLDHARGAVTRLVVIFDE